MSAGLETLPDLVPPQWDIAELVRRRALELGERPYISFAVGDRSLTFAEADRQSDVVAGILADVGVAQGDPVLLMLSNSAEFVLSWFGLAKLGAVQVPVNTAYRGDWLEHVIRTSGAHTIVCDGTTSEAVATISTSFDLQVLNADQWSLDQGVDHGVMNSDLATRVKNVSLHGGDTAAIHFTSGTTGRSKGAVVPLAQMDLLVRRNAQLLALRDDSVYFTELPLFHINAQMTVQGALLYGCQARIEAHFSASKWLERIRAAGATHTSMLGVMVDFILSQPPGPNDRDNVLDNAWCVPCVPAAVEVLRARFGIDRIVTSFGTTEIGMLARRVVEPGSTDESSGSPGTDFYEVQIVDPDTDRPVPVGAVGEIALRARDPWLLMQGYVDMPEQTVHAFRNLWLHTGDAGRLDERGHLTFVDRLHDRIRRRGENVASADLEHVLSTHPDVAEVAVVAVQADEGGEDEIKACIVLRRDGDVSRTIDLGAFWQWCAERLPYFAVPRYVDVRTEMPRTPTAKILKGPLRAEGIPAGIADRGPAPVGRSRA